MRRQWPWLLVTVLVVSGCSGSATTVGRVSGVLNPVAFLNGSQVGAGDDIPRGARLVTDERGVLEFDIHGILASCMLRPDSEIVVRGAAGAAFEYVAGEMWCQAKAEPREELTIEVGARQLHVEDARFGLRDGEVLMDSGEGEIVGSDGDRTKVPADTGCDMQSEDVRCFQYPRTREDLEYLAEVKASHAELAAQSAGSSSAEPSPTTTTSEPPSSTTQTEVTTTEPTHTGTMPTDTGMSTDTGMPTDTDG